jgi:ribosomal protein L11 methyltransferase
MLKTLQFKISTDPALVDAFSDYLIGVHDAATEFSVDDDGRGAVLQAFVEKDCGSGREIAQLQEEIRAYGAEIADIFSCAAPRVAVEVVENSDWAENWKAHFKPFAIVDGLVIAPTWEPYKVRGGEQVIVMDPGMAFGTGHHATTRLCLEMMQDGRVAPPGCRVLDVGTGTGILAMAALLKGASQALAIDNDDEAVAAARTNAERNGLGMRMEVSGMPLGQVAPEFDLVIANIVHDVLVELSDVLAAAARIGGHVLLSGILEGEQSRNLIDLFERKGFELSKRLSDESWCALLLHKLEPGTR